MIEEDAIILSIKPKHAGNILASNKKYEFRKSIWKSNKNIKKSYIYATSPVKKITGYFTIKRIFKGTPDILWEFFKEGSGISEKEFFNYFNSHSVGHAIEIDKILQFHKPLDPKELDPDFNAPQNFAYITSYNERLLNNLFLSSIISSFENQIIRLMEIKKNQEQKKRRIN